MELITALLLAGPLGYLGGNRPRAILLYLAVWAIVFPIQSVVVHSEDADDINVAYFIVNALILSFGIGLNQIGSSLRGRRGHVRRDRPSPARGVSDARRPDPAGSPPSR